MVSTSYPRNCEDHAGHFIAALAGELNRYEPITVLAPDHPAVDGFNTHPDITIRRFRWIGWQSRTSLAYGDGMIENLRLHTRIALRIPGFIRAMQHELIDLLTEMDTTTPITVVSHWILPTSLCCHSIINRSFPVSHLSVIHGSDLFLLSKFPHFFRQQCIRLLQTHPHRIAVIAPEMKHRLIAATPRCNPDRIDVLPMGVPVETVSVPGTGVHCEINDRSVQQKPDTKRNGLHVLFMGRLIPIKGADLVIRACTHLPQVTVHLAGDGPDRSNLETLASNLGVLCRFHGMVSGAAKRAIICTADLWVVPSRVTSSGQRDGLPTVILEAWAAGIPVIVSDSVAGEEILSDGVNCLKVSSGSVESIRRGIHQMLYHPETADFLRRNGAFTVRRFAWPAIGNLWYTSILRQRETLGDGIGEGP
ncbi:glycosyltransferase family 4 protein [bacterium]|nr:glycosyltransferase family 4 protein [candidate division CSSED10-310 bacterium]